MIKRNLRLTLKQILEILELRLKGLSYLKIGKKFNRDHSTILYWGQFYNAKPIIFLENEVQRKVILIKVKPDKGRMPEKIIFIIKKDFSVKKIKNIYKNLKVNKNKIQKIKNIKTKIKKDGIKFCRKCGKLKTNEKWMQTKYCSLACWYDFNNTKKEKIY